MNTPTANLISFAMDKAIDYVGRLDFQEAIREKKEILRHLQEALLPELMWQDATDWSFGETNERMAKLARQGWVLDGVVEQSQADDGSEGAHGKMYLRFKRAVKPSPLVPASKMQMERGA